MLSKFKGVEFSILHNYKNWRYSVICLWFRNKELDHPGINLEIQILGFGLEIDVYDSRHVENFQKKYYKTQYVHCVKCSFIHKWFVKCISEKGKLFLLKGSKWYGEKQISIFRLRRILERISS